jgi:hypothetical protein
MLIIGGKNLYQGLRGGEREGESVDNFPFVMNLWVMKYHTCGN